jgi:hypothetical protein
MLSLLDFAKRTLFLGGGHASWRRAIHGKGCDCFQFAPSTLHTSNANRTLQDCALGPHKNCNFS